MIEAQKNASDDVRGPIFIQPSNLAKECVLKDYQLEGVRWFISLFENRVSGSLADEIGLEDGIITGLMAQPKLMIGNEQWIYLTLNILGRIRHASFSTTSEQTNRH